MKATTWLCFPMWGRLAAVSVFIGAQIGIGADTNEVQNIRAEVNSNGAALFLPSSVVTSSYTISSIQTNGTLLCVTAEDACGVGTNGIFSYSLANTAAVVRVDCRDAAGNGCHFDYDPDGKVRAYWEMKADKLDGVFMKFHTNTQVSYFMIPSNNFFVGEAYQFGPDGVLTGVTTASVPVSLEYQVGPAP